MCGLVGCAGTIDRRAVDTFNDLLKVAALRGQHSTGVAGVKRGRDNDTDIIKRVGNPYELMEVKGYDDVASVGKKALIGHCRHATLGAINRDNAHPFDFSTVVGAHNGTLTWGSKNRLTAGGPDYGTDSEAIFAKFNKFQYKDILPQLDGAFALSWFEKNDNLLCLTRNKERPLFYAFTKDHKTLFWASEAIMLHLCFFRRDLEMDKVMLVNEDTVLTFQIPDFGKDFDHPKSAKFEMKVQAYASAFRRGTNHYPGWEEEMAAAEAEEDGEEEVPDVAEILKAGDPGPPFRSLAIDPRARSAEWAKTHYWNPEKKLWLLKAPVEAATEKTEEPSEKAGAKESDMGESTRDEKVKEAIDDMMSGSHRTNTVIDVDFKGGKKPRRWNRYKDSTGHQMSKRDFAKQCSDGCVWCSTALNWGDAVFFVNENRPICVNHLDDKEATEVMKGMGWIGEAND